MFATSVGSWRTSTASPRSALPFAAAALASFAVLGADSRWLVALGPHAVHALPFATAPTSGWHDVPVLAQTVLRALHDVFGDRGLVLAQLAAAFAAFRLLPRGLPGGLALLAAIPTIAVVRAELFSLVLFPVLLVLLERRPDRLWLCVPLIALWSNLHGSVLVGLALLWVFVAIERRRDWAVAVVSTLALCVTPALWHTPQYYWAVARNEAARRGVGLWQPLGLRPFDVLLAACVLALAVIATRGRAWRPWEAVACAGLAVATIHSARLGTWLAFVAAYPAARAWRRRETRATFFLVRALAALAVVGLVLGPARTGAPQLAERAARTGAPVLAEPITAEQVELAGGRVWVADPIDAFRRRDQRLYLDWLDGHGDAAVAHARYVLVDRHGAPGRRAARDRRLRAVAHEDPFVLYVVTTEPSGNPRR